MAKKKTGRPPKPPGERYRLVSVTLPPHQVDWVEAQDEGRSAVFQRLVEAEIKREQKRKARR
jgi:hypothetical protein